MKQRLLFREHRILIRHFRTIYTCSLAVGGEDNRVEPAVVGGQEVRAGLRHFRLEATGHGNLVEERSTFGGHQGECKYDEKGTMRHRLLRAEDPSMAGRSPASTRKSKSQPLKSVKYLGFPARNIYLSRKEKGGNRTRIQNLALKMIYRMDITFTTSFQEFCASYTSMKILEISFSFHPLF